MKKAVNEKQSKITCGDLEMDVKYYHISRIENKDSIIRNGIRANEGHIFMCTSLKQLPMIAVNQIGTNEYSIFQIGRRGITSEILSDNVAESGSETQFYIQQDIIVPEDVFHIKDELWNVHEIKEYCFRLSSQRYGLSETGINTLLCQQVRLNKEWCEYHNQKYGTNITPLEIYQRALSHRSLTNDDH